MSVYLCVSIEPLRRLTDEHPNVIRYYHHECDDKFLYLALQYCPLSLHQLLMLAYDYEKRRRSSQSAEEEQEEGRHAQSLSQSLTLVNERHNPLTQLVSLQDLMWFSSHDAKKLLLFQLANGILHLHSRNIGMY